MRYILFFILLAFAISWVFAEEQPLVIDRCVLESTFNTCADMPQGDKPDPKQLEKCEAQARMEALRPRKAIAPACLPNSTKNLK
jgi:hypothetical protein